MSSKYNVDNMYYSDLEGKVILPAFQRKLVWSKREKEEFIDTLHKGFPFGSILIYKYENEMKYSLIDGLQRYTTILDYKSNPENYIQFDEFVEMILIIFNDIIVSHSARQNLKEKVDNALKDYIRYLTENSEKFTKFIEILEEHLSVGKIPNEFLLKLSNIHDEFKDFKNNYLDLDKLKIPTITFTGELSDLATVFENLNRTGKKLSKYQVFAAQWSKFPIKLIDEEFSSKILKITIERYKDLIETRELEIENFNEETMMENREVNLSEYCYAVGKLILEAMPIFWDVENEDLANQIGYSTIAMVLGISNKKLEKVIDMVQILQDGELTEKLVSNIVNVYSDINQRFKKPFRVPGRNQDRYFGGNVGTDFQIMSYFATLWNIKFGHVGDNLELNAKPHYKNNYKKVLDYLLKHYIMDAVTSKWSGSGDTKLDHIAVDLNTPYLVDVKKQDLENNLLYWYEETLKKNSVNFEKVSRMLYTVYCSFYSDSFTESRYDSEHVVPRYFINKVRETQSIPGGVLGNIMYLESSINRSKGVLSLYDARSEIYNLNTDLLKIQEYPSQNDLEKIGQEFERFSGDYSNLYSVIKNRGNYIINMLLSNLYQ